MENAPTLLHVACRENESHDSFWVCCARRSLRQANHALACGSPEAATAHMSDFDRFIDNIAR